MIVVTGIHTDVGKTVTAAILAEALQAYYWKPIQCGMPKDRDWVEKMLTNKDRCLPERYCFQLAASPHLAAREEGLEISSCDFMPPFRDEPLIIEGAGGLLAPINSSESFADLASQWQAKWVVVHRHYLGSFNHFLLTLESMRARNLPLLGVVFNGQGDQQTEEMLLKRAQAPCLGRMAWQREITKEFIHKTAESWKTTLHGQSGIVTASGIPSRKL